MPLLPSFSSDALPPLIDRVDRSHPCAVVADPGTLLDLLEETSGELPEPEKVENPSGDYSGFVNYTWDGLKVFTDTEREAPATAAITAPSLNGVPIVTEEGLAVGSTRQELLDAGAWGLVDTDDPSTAEVVGLGRREVPGVESLTHPGSVGILYELFWFDGDVVTQIQVPSNDFSDL